MTSGNCLTNSAASGSAEWIITLTRTRTSIKLFDGLKLRRWFLIRLGQPVSPHDPNVLIRSGCSQHLGTLPDARLAARLYEGVDALAWVAPDGTVLFFTADEVFVDGDYLDGEGDMEAPPNRRAA